MIRVVIDTNIVVSAALQRAGYPAAVVDLVTHGEVIPCVSAAILREYQEVLSRARIGVDPVRAELIHRLMLSAGILVNPSVPVNVSPDPDDNMFLECAEEARADFLITGNTADFPIEHKTTLIVTPRAFIEAWRMSRQ